MLRGMGTVTGAALTVVGLQGCAVAAAATFVRDGRAAGVIVTAKDPTPASRLAALELQHHIEQITGAVVPIKGPGDTVEGARILVGESAATRKLGLKGKDLQIGRAHF